MICLLHTIIITYIYVKKSKKKNFLQKKVPKQNRPTDQEKTFFHASLF